MAKDEIMDNAVIGVRRPDQGGYKPVANDIVRRAIEDRLRHQADNEAKMDRILAVADKAANAVENVTRMAGDMVQAFKTTLRLQERYLTANGNALAQVESKVEEPSDDDSETKGS